jgi:hypothetical protein
VRVWREADKSRCFTFKPEIKTRETRRTRGQGRKSLFFRSNDSRHSPFLKKLIPVRGRGGWGRFFFNFSNW